MSDWKLISEATASGASSVEFTDLTGFKIFKWVFIDVNPATDLTRFNFQVNADGQTGFNETITSTYFDTYHYESGDPYGPELRYVASQDQAQGTSYQNLTAGLGGNADECCAGEIFLYHPESTTYVKHFYATVNSVYSAQGADSAATYNTYIGGYINNAASAITAIDFKMTSGTFSGLIKQYGLVAS